MYLKELFCILINSVTYKKLDHRVIASGEHVKRSNPPAAFTAAQADAKAELIFGFVFTFNRGIGVMTSETKKIGFFRKLVSGYCFGM